MIDLLANHAEPFTTWPPLRIAQWALIASLLVASEAANLLGHGALSWTIDGLALAAFGAFTLARRARAGA